MKKFILYLIMMISLLGNNTFAQNQFQHINNNFFIENKGQWPSEVKYLARVGGMNAWITNSGVVYDYFRITRNYNESETMKMPRYRKQEFERKNTSAKGHVVKMSFVEVNKEVVQQGNNKKEGYYNYFIGNEKSKWASYVGLYGDVEQNEIYQNIDVKYYFDKNSIRYDYIVKPEADLSQLRMRFEGQESIKVNDAGELVIKTSLGEVTNGKLYSYQLNEGNKSEVGCKFVQGEDGTVRLEATGYDKSKELIIDPLIYSTLIGGSNDDIGHAITIDSVGNAYLTGNTLSIDFPTSVGAYQTKYYNHGEIFVSKLNSTGSGLVYSTFIEGDNADCSNSIAIDAEGNAYITGFTNSTNYPITLGAFQNNYGGGAYDIFVTKLNPTGSGLVYSTFLGGSGEDAGESIAINNTGNAYITGTTYSSNYPITPGAFKTTINDNYNVFVTELNPAGSGLVYSTFIGMGNAYSIALDSLGNIYITGGAESNFPTTPGAFQSTLGGGNYDGFITKLNSSGNGLIYSTFIGGNGVEACYSISIDHDGNAYITGYTTSLNFPTTPGAFQTTFGGGYYDMVVSKLNPPGNGLVYSTFIGGDNSDFGESVTIDGEGNAYLTGDTKSMNFPTTPFAFQNNFGTYNTETTAIITKLNKSGSALVYSTFVGGRRSETGTAIVADNSGNAYITGNTNSYDFPTSPGAFQTNWDGYYSDIFALKINLSPVPIKITGPKGGEIWKSGNNQIISWLIAEIPSIKIQYSIDLGVSWNTIVNNYPSSMGSYSWAIPFVSSPKTWIRISDATDGSIFAINNNPFVIWQVVTNEQTPVVGQNSLSFGATNISLKLFVNTPSQITATYYEYEVPLTGSLPNHVSSVLPYYWKISASDSISFNNGYISVPYSSLRGILYPSWITVWLKRTNPGDAWTNIGGDIINGNFVSTIPFSSFSEFAVGLYYAPTPVELNSFSGSSNNDIINLRWRTATETNNRGFEVQRKSASYDFVTVAFVSGNGTSTKTNNYTWSEKLQPGKYSYRLKQVDYDGKFEYSKEVEVVVVPKNFSLEQNYPNPFNPSTIIKYNVPVESSISIKMFNSLGENVKEYSIGNKLPGFYELNFVASGLASGVYFYSIRAISKDGKNDFSAVKKMMLIK